MLLWPESIVNKHSGDGLSMHYCLVQGLPSIADEQYLKDAKINWVSHPSPHASHFGFCLKSFDLAIIAQVQRIMTINRRLMTVTMIYLLWLYHLPLIVISRAREMGQFFSGTSCLQILIIVGMSRLWVSSMWKPLGWCPVMPNSQSHDHTES